MVCGHLALGKHPVHRRPILGDDVFQHRLRLLGDARFWIALENTLYFVLVGGPLSIAVSLGAALLVNARAVRLKGLFRTIFFLPSFSVRI